MYVEEFEVNSSLTEVWLVGKVLLSLAYVVLRLFKARVFSSIVLA
jgi:hypothetical protein